MFTRKSTAQATATLAGETNPISAIHAALDSSGKTASVHHIVAHTITLQRTLLVLHAIMQLLHAQIMWTLLVRKNLDSH